MRLEKRWSNIHGSQKEEISNEVKDLIYDRETKSIKENMEPLFIQMPCNLPFELQPDQLMKIGKLRIMKSGKVILRIKNESGGNQQYIDMDVSQGITNNFY
tara:strand:- start:120 stop:422 length:303 start_codon:yes stop_codon:yes gene_type:complete